MSMDSVENAKLFWRIVEHSLVDLYGWQPSAARDKVLRLRGRMTKAAIAQDLSYHSQPLHVASDIAQVVKPISDAMLAKYEELVKRVTGERSGPSVFEEGKGRKPSLNAPNSAQPQAVSSR